MTSRELVRRTMEFRNTDARAPRDLWVLPWASIHHGAALADIRRRYPNDYGGVPVVLKETSPVEKGDPCAIGEYTDPWGCTFLNIQQGVIGEVKQPLVTDDDWLDTSRVVIPEYQLSFDIEQVNAACAETDRWITAGCCPRPFEQLQFIRGSENLYMDLADPAPGFFAFLERMHDFYCRLMTKWAQTDVDCLTFMDDWGSQKSLLISPEMWRKYFRLLYQDYIDIAHRHGKKISMHSDGNTLSIIPDLIEMGLDALNTQIFCIGVDKLAPFKGKITFWGEICRQHLLPHGTVEDIRSAVTQVFDTLWDNGGCIAQCEFGPAAKPENVETVFETWDRLTGGW